MHSGFPRNIKIHFRRIYMKKVLVRDTSGLCMPGSSCNGKDRLSTPTTMGQDDFKYFSTDLGMALSYMPLSPAEPLGDKLPGFDAGVEVTFIQIRQEPALLVRTSERSGPDEIPSSSCFRRSYPGRPPYHPHRSRLCLCQRSDTATSSYTGYELKYAILEGGVAMPAVAIRGAYTKLSGIDGSRSRHKSLDVSISKGIAIFTPYAGIGQVLDHERSEQ